MQPCLGASFIEPSPYLGMLLNYACADGVPHYVPRVECSEGTTAAASSEKEGSVRWGGT